MKWGRVRSLNQTCLLALPAAHRGVAVHQQHEKQRGSMRRRRGSVQSVQHDPRGEAADILLMVQMSEAGNIQASFPPSEPHLLTRKPSELRGWGGISQTRCLQLDRQTGLHSQQRRSLWRLHRYRTEPLQLLKISIRALNGCLGG